MNYLSFISSGLATFLSIILFFVALGVLVTIHELGHFIAAKSFKVYCSDFSIGFGPKIVKIKRKKGETKFSIGIIPLGGYVSMYGEEGEIEEGLKIPQSRSLAGISRWKRIVIMSAGIIMNFLLAYIIFLIALGCFKQSMLYTNLVPNESSDAIYKSSLVVHYDEGDSSLKSGDTFNLVSYEYTYEGTNYKISNIIDNAYFDYKNDDGNIIKYALVLNTNDAELGIYNRDIAQFLHLYKTQEVKNAKKTEFNGDIKTVDVYLPVYENKKLVEYQPTKEKEFVINHPSILTAVKGEDGSSKYELVEGNSDLILMGNGSTFESFGYSFMVQEKWLGVDAFNQAGVLWVRSANLISNALGQLFIGQGWENLGGPVAILTQTTSTLINNPFYVYLQQWGMISVNLALFNLLPFPGLDGWQILVELVEGGVNGVKKIKAKFKTKDKPAKNNKIEIKEATSDNSTKVEALNSADIVIGEVSENKVANEWKISPKFKTIMSYAGLALLFGLMIIVFIKDIIGLF